MRRVYAGNAVGHVECMRDGVDVGKDAFMSGVGGLGFEVWDYVRVALYESWVSVGSGRMRRVCLVA